MNFFKLNVITKPPLKPGNLILLVTKIPPCTPSWSLLPPTLKGNYYPDLHSLPVFRLYEMELYGIFYPVSGFFVSALCLQDSFVLLH